MRVLVISDVHSNLEAMDAVLADATRGARAGWDMIWSLGDIVGYGPDPNACITRLNEYQHWAVPGNHDWGVLGKLDLEEFNPEAREANLWTRAQLSAASRTYLESLLMTRSTNGYLLAHGSPRQPIWEYLIFVHTAKLNFAHMQESFCLVGHTHVPVLFRSVADSGECQALQLPEDQAIQLDEERYIINPGSVGQPRDGDARAAYLLLDTDNKIIEHRRVAYDIQTTQNKMRQFELPARLISRLEFGW